MSKVREILVIYSITLCLLTVAGIIWWQYDRKSIEKLDYRKQSQFLSRHDNQNSRKLLNDIKDQLERQFMHIFDERKVNNTEYELIGYSRSCWLFSGFIHKVTIVGTPQFNPNNNSIPLVTDIYATHKNGGALPFLSLSIFVLLAIGTIYISKNNLPHIFVDIN